VDLLVSIAYAAAAENVLDEPLPIGMGLRVKVPDLPKAPPNMQSQTPGWLPLFATPPVVPIGMGPPATATTLPGAVGQPPATDITAEKLQVGTDGLCDFDDLSISQVCITIVDARS
jgi:ubiquitin-conjugating enzyme E2 Q